MGKRSWSKQAISVICTFSLFEEEDLELTLVRILEEALHPRVTGDISLDDDPDWSSLVSGTLSHEENDRIVKTLDLALLGFAPVIRFRYGRIDPESELKLQIDNRPPRGLEGMEAMSGMHHITFSVRGDTLELEEPLKVRFFLQLMERVFEVIRPYHGFVESHTRMFPLRKRDPLKTVYAVNFFGPELVESQTSNLDDASWDAITKHHWGGYELVPNSPVFGTSMDKAATRIQKELGW